MNGGPHQLHTPITGKPVFHPGIQVQADQRLSAVSLLRWRQETSGRRNNGGPTGPVGQSRHGCKDALSWNIQPADGREPGRRPRPAHFQTTRVHHQRLGYQLQPQSRGYPAPTQPSSVTGAVAGGRGDAQMQLAACGEKYRHWNAADRRARCRPGYRPGKYLEIQVTEPGMKDSAVVSVNHRQAARTDRLILNSPWSKEAFRLSSRWAIPSTAQR